VSAVPEALQAAVSAAMDAVRVVMAEGTRAGVNTASAAAPALRSAFFDGFTAFAVVTNKVSLAAAPSDACSSTCLPVFYAPPASCSSFPTKP
jgi:hypothetical protein